MKAEASGYPGWVHSLEDEDRYVDSFWQSEGIRLDKEATRFNAVKRGLANLCLNSMWAKLPERNDRTMTKIITESKEMYGFLATPCVDVTNLAFAIDDVVYISWERGVEKRLPSLCHKNEMIGTYVTAVARIHLYRYLDRVGENAIYCATESVINIQL